MKYNVAVTYLASNFNIPRREFTLKKIIDNKWIWMHTDWLPYDYYGKKWHDIFWKYFGLRCF